METRTHLPVADHPTEDKIVCTLEADGGCPCPCHLAAFGVNIVLYTVLCYNGGERIVPPLLCTLTDSTCGKHALFVRLGRLLHTVYGQLLERDASHIGHVEVALDQSRDSRAATQRHCGPFLAGPYSFKTSLSLDTAGDAVVHGHLFRSKCA